MEKEKLFTNEGNTFPPTWNSTQFGMKIYNSELNSTSEKLPNCFFNPNWENSVDQSDPFESALSSIVSSPTTSHPGIPVNNGENIVLRELIGRLGSICNSGGEISPHSFVDGNGNHSTDTYCYTTPLNSPPKLNLSMMDHQIRGNLPIIGNQFPFSTDPEFAERAAKFSCFGGKSFGGINGQTGENESEFPHKLSRVSSSQSFKVAGSQVGFQENKDGFLQEGIQVADKKFSRLSRSSTPEKAKFGDLMEESSVSEQIPGGEIGVKGKSDANAKKRKSIPKGKAKEIPSATCSEDAKAAAENEESDSKRSKGDEGNSNGKDEAKDNGNQKQTKDNSKPIEPPKDYIHVRARRGQATDSHSLAERVRREKISERMKFLQDLVPGCNKVTGKAVMLDEIINYVQSLQRQVEFLSMKLSTVNPRMDFNMEALLSKDIFQSRGSLPHNIYPVDTSAQVFPYTYQSQQGSSNIHSNIPNGVETPFSINSLNAAIRRNTGLQLPSVDGFNEAAASQVSAFWEDDLQSVVQMGFGQNQPESFHGSNAANNMKVEL